MKRSAPFNAKNRPTSSKITRKQIEGREKKKVDYYTPKKAFDQVMEHFPMDLPIDLFGSELARQLDRTRIEADLPLVIQFYREQPKKTAKGKAQGIVAPKGTPVKNWTAPNVQDFKVDVEKQIKLVIKDAKDMCKFVRRYIFGLEELSTEEQHKFARYEQQIGTRFIRARIYPLGKYFVSIRTERKGKARQ